MRTRTVKVTPVGSAGAAVASTAVGTPTGALRAVRVVTAGQSSGTTDVTVSSIGQTVATFASLGDGEVIQQPLALASDEDGVDLDTAGDEARVRPIVHGTVEVAVENADPVVDGVVVTLFLEDGER